MNNSNVNKAANAAHQTIDQASEAARRASASMPRMPMANSSMMSKPIVWLGAAAAAGGAYWYYKNRDEHTHSVTVKRESK